MPGTRSFYAISMSFPVLRFDQGLEDGFPNLFASVHDDKNSTKSDSCKGKDDDDGDDNILDLIVFLRLGAIEQPSLFKVVFWSRRKVSTAVWCVFREQSFCRALQSREIIFNYARFIDGVDNDLASL